MITFRNYHRAESLQEAWELGQKRSNVILGGMLWLKMSNKSYQTAIDLSGLGLDTVEETAEEYRIGCMVTLRALELHPGLEALTGGALREALHHIVGVQFRNVATVGGSVFGRYGFSDVDTILLAMDASVELFQGGVMPIGDFLKMRRERDLLVRIIVPKKQASYDYRSVRITKTDFPVLACAAVREGDSIRFSIGARPGVARLTDPVAVPKTAEEAAETAEQLANALPTGSNLRGTAAYRSRMIRVLSERAMLRLGGLDHAD